MTIHVQRADLYIRNMHTRMPFRYGIAEMTALPHLFMVLTCEIDGEIQTGISADALPPKWFTKNPDSAFEGDIADMLTVIQSAADVACEIGAASSAFDLWQQIYTRQTAWAEGTDYPPLLWNFGVSLVERAVIDAFCRAKAMPFSVAVRSNALGIQLGDVHEELAGYEAGDLLPDQPQRQLIARHTVGLSDPLTDAGIAPDERIDDGLPQSLEACIKVYGLTHFKLKIGGDIEEDVARLRRIADVIEGAVVGEYAFTLDGNEQYSSVADFRVFWQAIANDPELSGFLSRLLLVEQPLHRDIALGAEVEEALTQWPDRPPIIIDESDSSLTSLSRALDCGYAGASHKNCKGVFKGLINACLLEYRRRNYPELPSILTGEDLTNVGPVALLQDLAVMATLGVTHIERNGHHYFRGLSMYPDELQTQVLKAHSDLYRRHADGFAALNIQDGGIAVGSVVEAPFGFDFDFDPSRFTSLAAWRFESLGTIATA